MDIAIDALGDVSTDMDATYIKKLILSVAKWEQQRLISFVYRLRIHTKQLLLELSSMWICFLCKFQSKSGSIKVLYV